MLYVQVLEGWSLGQSKYDNVTTLLKAKCTRDVESAHPIAGAVSTTTMEKYQCGYLFAECGMSDAWIGLILLVFSLALLCVCLVILVKVLNSLMRDKVAEIIRNVLNADIPHVPWLTGYLALAVGAVITFLVQSSSVFTSTLTPLCGAGLFELERAYPLTLGSNIGTTTTGLLAAFASDADRLHNSLQIALCHLFFNVTAIVVFYPIPFMRWPIPMARVMGKVVGQYRWFAIFYLFFMFFLFPLYIFGLSLLGPVAIYVGFVPLFLLLVTIIIINVIQVLIWNYCTSPQRRVNTYLILVQTKKPEILPNVMKDWSFLPEWMRSLEPYDR